MAGSRWNYPSWTDDTSVLVTSSKVAARLRVKCLQQPVITKGEEIQWTDIGLSEELNCNRSDDA